MITLKAVIMAGGKGTRLRPICENMPKPMTRLMGRPLMEHTVELLKRNGFTELCVTLGHMPDKIRRHFGNGSLFGVSMEYRVEEEPLGTAGGVRACMDFVDGEDFLVISGDAACDFNLRSFANAHFSSGADLSMALYPHPEPLRYGTVVTDKDNRVISFIEKPQWERVVTDLVNTGIYMLSPRVMELVPKNQPFDFARDLFPLLAQRGFLMKGIRTDGYWCDIGDPKSYLECSMDALNGKLRLNSATGNNSQWDACVCLPSLICSGAVIEPGAVIDRSIIHPGSHIGENAVIKNSVIDGAFIGEGCTVDSAVICENTRIPDEAFVCPGAVVSQSSAIAEESSSPAKPRPRRCTGLVRELSCESRARLMREMSALLWEVGADFSDGIMLRDGSCTVRIAPMSGESAVTIEASGGRETDRISSCRKYALLAESLGGHSKNYE